MVTLQHKERTHISSISGPVETFFADIYSADLVASLWASEVWRVMQAARFTAESLPSLPELIGISFNAWITTRQQLNPSHECVCISNACKQCSDILICDKQTIDLSSLNVQLWMWIWLRFIWGFGYLTPRTCCTLIRTLTLWAHTHAHTARKSGLFIGTYVRVERTFSCPYSCLR